MWREREFDGGTYEPDPKRFQLILGWRIIVSVTVHVANVNEFEKKQVHDARHGIKFRHVGHKVHLVCLDGVCAHEAPGAEVEDGEEHDREVVGHEDHLVRRRRPVTLEEHIPPAELEESMRAPVSTCEGHDVRGAKTRRGHAR